MIISYHKLHKYTKSKIASNPTLQNLECYNFIEISIQLIRKTFFYSYYICKKYVILFCLLDYKQDLSQQVSDLIRQDWREQEPHLDTESDLFWQYGHV